MSDMTNAPTTVTEKRAIRMGEFNTKEAQAAALMGKTTPIGQVVGIAYSTQIKTNTFADGKVSTSLLLLGQFEAINFKTGEVMQSGAAYLPNYFAEQIKAQMDSTAGGVSFAVEIVIEPNPKADAGITFQYAVSNLLPPAANDPLQELKRKAMAGGRLKLSMSAPAVTAPQVESSAEEAAAAEEGSIAGDARAASNKGKGK